jgi:hypothetical protein
MGKAKGGKKRPLSSAPKKAEPKINPFERKIVRPKFSVLGRNLKETEKTAGQSRQVATESVRLRLKSPQIVQKHLSTFNFICKFVFHL